MSSTQQFGVEDFLTAFGAPLDAAAVIAPEVARYDLSYRRLTAGERAAVVHDIVARLASFTKVGAHRHQIWNQSWSELAARFAASGGELSSLEPAFISASPVVRMGDDFARPSDPRFELHWFRILRLLLFRTYLGEFPRVLEFGCGSGYNLAHVAELYPNKELIGLDWSDAAVALVDRIGATRNYRLSGRQFDFFNPDPTLALGPDTAVMTFAALEQIGGKFMTFLDWLIERKPGLVINMEPALELYDATSAFDELAIRYHTFRDYLSGYFPHIQQLEKDGKVQILKLQRPRFGSLYHEGYSLLVWRPVS
jgi:SAM-dependent methyltransferase